MLEQFKSTVRPVVTLAFALAFIYFTYEKIISSDVFVGMATLVIKYWFDSRAQESSTNGKGGKDQ